MGADQTRDNRRELDVGESTHCVLHYLRRFAYRPRVFIAKGVDRDSAVARTRRRDSKGARRNGGEQQNRPFCHAARPE
jgi:hypothetical protein